MRVYLRVLAEGMEDLLRSWDRILLFYLIFSFIGDRTIIIARYEDLNRLSIISFIIQYLKNEANSSAFELLSDTINEAQTKFI